jgi:integrase
LDAIKAEKPAAAHNASNRVAAVLRWTAGKHKIANPFAGQEEELPSAPPERQSYLSGDAMQKIYAAAKVLDSPGCELIRVLMLTVIRRNEVAQARWSEFGDDFTAWVLPSRRMKGGANTHWIPLAPQVRAILQSLPRHGESDLVFTRTGRVAVTAFSALKTKIDKALVGAKLPSWTWHDFRRSFVVWASTNGERFDFNAADIADRCLGHEPFGRIQKNYNPFGFQRERRILLAAWADYLAGEAKQKPEEAPVSPEAARALLAKTAAVAAALRPARDLHADLTSMIVSHEAVARANAEIWKRSYNGTRINFAKTQKRRRRNRRGLQSWLWSKSECGLLAASPLA